MNITGGGNCHVLAIPDSPHRPRLMQEKRTNRIWSASGDIDALDVAAQQTRLYHPGIGPSEAGWTEEIRPGCDFALCGSFAADAVSSSLARNRHALAAPGFAHRPTCSRRNRAFGHR